MDVYKKIIIAIVSMALFGSCSQSIRYFGLESKYLKNNHGKEKDLILEISISKDTIFANSNKEPVITAVLTYCGDEYYYFKTSPATWRMDSGIASPNSFLRLFFHNNEKCSVKEELIMHNDIMPQYCNFLLYPQKSMTLKRPFNIERIYNEEKRNEEKNNQYGEYQVQMSYITEFNDTILSNKIKFWYLK